MPDALLTQMLEGEKGCDICCIFPAPRCLAELYNWVFEVQVGSSFFEWFVRYAYSVVTARLWSATLSLHTLSTLYSAIMAMKVRHYCLFLNITYHFAAERNECVSLLAICSADSGHAASRMCRALDKTHYSCLSDFAAALQRKRSDIVVDDDQPIDVMHVIVAR